MTLPAIQSQRQLYRLWFEFLKMAQREPGLQDSLRKSSDFYAPWGDVNSTSFDLWWVKHKHLFGHTQVTEVDRVSATENVLYVAIPLSQPVSKSLSAVKHLIEMKQTAKLLDLGIDPRSTKSLSSAFGRYDFTSGVEIRGRVLYEIQIIYSVWQDLHKPAVNSNFITAVIDVLASRPRAKWLPHLLRAKPMTDKKGNLRYDEGQVRQIRRYLKKGYEVCRSVSDGDFPGRVTL